MVGAGSVHGEARFDVDSEEVGADVYGDGLAGTAFADEYLLGRHTQISPMTGTHGPSNSGC
jgi:hypothetical protein